jgi:GNAT superfamily N-acetyltransferase
MQLTIAYLSDGAHLVPLLARWHHEQFGYLAPENALERHVAVLQNTLNRDKIPLTFVALSGAVPLGSASLVCHDMSTRPELTPWLARVYVVPERRGQGIGTQLVRRTVVEADRLGVEHLFLYTPDKERFYARMGWAVRERVEYRGWNVALMEIAPPGTGERGET